MSFEYNVRDAVDLAFTRVERWKEIGVLDPAVLVQGNEATFRINRANQVNQASEPKTIKITKCDPETVKANIKALKYSKYPLIFFMVIIITALAVQLFCVLPFAPPGVPYDYIVPTIIKKIGIISGAIALTALGIAGLIGWQRARKEKEVSNYVLFRLAEISSGGNITQHLRYSETERTLVGELEALNLGKDCLPVTS